MSIVVDDVSKRRTKRSEELGGSSILFANSIRDLGQNALEGDISESFGVLCHVSAGSMVFTGVLDGLQAEEVLNGCFSLTFSGDEVLLRSNANADIRFLKGQEASSSEEGIDDRALRNNSFGLRIALNM